MDVAPGWRIGLPPVGPCSVNPTSRLTRQLLDPTRPAHRVSSNLGPPEPLGCSAQAPPPMVAIVPPPSRRSSAQAARTPLPPRHRRPRRRLPPPRRPPPQRRLALHPPPRLAPRPPAGAVWAAVRGGGEAGVAVSGTTGEGVVGGTRRRHGRYGPRCRRASRSVTANFDASSRTTATGLRWGSWSTSRCAWSLPGGVAEPHTQLRNITSQFRPAVNTRSKVTTSSSTTNAIVRRRSNPTTLRPGRTSDRSYPRSEASPNRRRNASTRSK